MVEALSDISFRHMHRLLRLLPSGPGRVHKLALRDEPIGLPLMTVHYMNAKALSVNSLAIASKGCQIIEMV